MNLPIVPLELVDGILSHLEKEDLLNCRFVSKSWNELCLSSLKKSNCTIKLNSGQIKEYTDFIKSTGAPPILAIRVTQEPNTPLALLAKTLDSLIDFTGPECIVALELHHFYDPDYSQFLPVLERLSPGLLSLHVKHDYWQQNVPTEQLHGITEFNSHIQSMRFPKLEHLKCGSWHENSGMNPELVSPNLIGWCPSLQVLEYFQMGQNPVHIPFGRGLKSLALAFDQSDPNSIVQQIQACQNKVTLNALSLDFRHLTDTQFLAAKNMLQELSPHLKSLALSVHDYSQNPIPCPMQVLRVLDIRNIDLLQIPDMLNQQMQGFRPAFFPVLTDIAFPMELYLKDNTELKLDDSEVFQTVRKITPRLQQHWGYTRNIMTSAHIRKCWANIFHVFPNAVIVTVQYNEQRGYFDLGEQAIRCLVQCPQAVCVQELRVMNYKKDYIGRILHVMDNPPMTSIALDSIIIPGEESEGLYANNVLTDLYAELGIKSSRFDATYTNLTPHKQILTATVDTDKCNLKNLSKLRLLRGSYPPNKKESDSLEFALDFDISSPRIQGVQRILFVDLFAKHFPSLRSLELSSKMLSSDYFTVWRKIRQIESRYPMWEVNATCQDFKWTPLPSVH